jgi:hypothetical protein
VDTTTYEVEFPDDHSKEYTSTVIAQNMYSQCDQERDKFALMQNGVGHKTDGHDVGQSDMHIKHGVNTQMRETMTDTANG